MRLKKEYKIKISLNYLIVCIIINYDIFYIICLLIMRLKKEYKIKISLNYLIVCIIINYDIFNNLNKIIMREFL